MVPGYVGGVLVDESQFKGIAVLKHPAIYLSTAHFIAIKKNFLRLGRFDFKKYDKLGTVSNKISPTEDTQGLEIKLPAFHLRFRKVHS